MCPTRPRSCAPVRHWSSPGGQVFFSTLNRNPKAFLFAIVGAEHVLKLLPKGTHEYAKFIRPSELAQWCRDAGLAARTHARHAVQPADRALLAVGRHQRELPLRAAAAAADECGDATGAVRPRRHPDRQRPRPGGCGQRHARGARPGAAAPRGAAPDGRRRCARDGRRRPWASNRATMASMHCGSEFLDRYQAALARVDNRLRRHGAGARPPGRRRAALGHRDQQGRALHAADRARACTWTRRAAVVISGDTTPHSKPHPEPLLEAARRVGVDTGECVYVGDDHARRAGRPRRRHDHAGRRLGLPRARASRSTPGAHTPCSPSRPRSCIGCNWPKLRCLRGRPGFDAGTDPTQGMPSTSSLVNPLETK